MHLKEKFKTIFVLFSLVLFHEDCSDVILLDGVTLLTSGTSTPCISGRQCSFQISGRQHIAPPKGRSCPPQSRAGIQSWRGAIMLCWPSTWSMALCYFSRDFMDSWGQWCNLGECSQGLFKIRHRWVIFNRQLFSFLFMHHHQSEYHKYAKL